MRCDATGKIRYPSRESADTARARLDYGEKLAPYRCPGCGGWHLGGHHRGHRGDELAQLPRSWRTGEPLKTTIAERVQGEPHET